MSSNSLNGHRGRRGNGRGPGPASNSGRGRGRGRGRGHGRGGSGGGEPPVDRTGVPKGICNFYWSKGTCDRVFDCTFKHEAKPEVQNSSAPTQPADYTPDFFSPEVLAINNGTIVDAQHNLRPTEAHNHLKPYLFDDFKFRNATHVEGFSRILASVNSRNRAWVRERATMPMSMFSDEYTRYRIPIRPRLVKFPKFKYLKVDSLLLR